MEIVIAIILIAGGLAAIFYLRPKILNKVMEIKFMQTKTIAQLRDMFAQMDEMGLGAEYREFVELKGTVAVDAPVETPFSERQVAYCESKFQQVTEIREQYRDKEGNFRTQVRKQESTLSDEKSSQEIKLVDSSGSGEVILEVGGVGCELDIPKTFDRFEPKANMGRYRGFRSYSSRNFGAETLGFKMLEKTIALNQSLYVIGEAFRMGDAIHIGKPQDGKKPFIVSTKSEENLVNYSNQNAKMALIGGVIAVIAGIALGAYYFVQL